VIPHRERIKGLAIARQITVMVYFGRKSEVIEVGGNEERCSEW
jgi:hypothetical protein